MPLIVHKIIYNYFNSTVEVIFSLSVENSRVAESLGPFVVTIIRAGDINVNATVDLKIRSASGKLDLKFNHWFMDIAINGLKYLIVDYSSVL